jgi:hypothetical protein
MESSDLIHVATAMRITVTSIDSFDFSLGLTLNPRINVNKLNPNVVIDV